LLFQSGSFVWVARNGFSNSGIFFWVPKNHCPHSGSFVWVPTNHCSNSKIFVWVWRTCCSNLAVFVEVPRGHCSYLGIFVSSQASFIQLPSKERKRKLLARAMLDFSSHHIHQKPLVVRLECSIHFWQVFVFTYAPAAPAGLLSKFCIFFFCG